MTDVLIDLDVSGPPPDPDTRPRLWQGPSARQVRAVLVVAVLLTAMFGVGPALPPRPARFAGPVRIPGTGADELLLGSDLIVVNSSRDQRVLGYSLSGTLKWAVGLPFPRASLARLTDQVVLLTAPMWPGQTVGLDRATGAVRWTFDGLLMSVVDDTVVVTAGQPDPNGLTVPDGAPEDRIVGLDANTGRERWRATTTGIDGQRGMPIADVDHGPVGWIRVGSDGAGERLDYRTGRWRPIDGLPEPPGGRVAHGSDGAALYGTYQGALEVGELTVVVNFQPDLDGSGPADPDAGSAIAYGPHSPHPLWQVKVAATEPVTPCGPWVCVIDTDTTRVVDPATGADVRRIGWPRVIVGSAERFLGYDYAGSAATTQVAVFDARSGRVLGAYLGWLLVSARFMPWVPILHRGNGLRWELATLSLDTGVAYPLGTFDAAGERACQNTATHVACTIRSGETLIWRHAP